MHQVMIPIAVADDDDRYCSQYCPWYPKESSRCRLFQTVLGLGRGSRYERGVYCRQATKLTAPKANLKDMKIGGITLR